MIKINEIIVCEGKYDKIKLATIFDTMIISVGGFSIFKNKKQLDMLKKIAEEKGLIIATDSDSAGFKIRNYIKNYINDKYIINVYLPDVFGKEKRKASPSKEGKLGVEGINKDLIIAAFSKAGVLNHEKPIVNKRKITKSDFFEYGLTGSKNSTDKRNLLKKLLDFPERMSQNSLLEALNIMITFDEFLEYITKIDNYLKTVDENN